jgi:hypothetical protein
MQFFRCKCGKTSMHTSMGSAPCSVCDTCGSDLASAPSLHAENPPPHDPCTTVTIVTYQGQTKTKTVTECTRCHKVLSQVDA